MQGQRNVAAQVKAGSALTLKDIASRAGVSVSTVSRVVNDRNGVSPDTAEKVNRIVRQLGYYPNEIARSLKGSKTYSVAFIVPDITNPYFLAVVKGAEKILAREGYFVTVCNTDEDEVRERKYVEALLAKKMDGLLVTSATTDGGYLARVNRIVPVVQVDRLVNPGLDSVRVDNIDGALHAISHLVSRGYRRIATIAGPERYTPGRERLEGYRKGLELHGVEVSGELVEMGDFSIRSGWACCQRLLAIQPKINAIFTANNFMGVGAVQAIAAAGLSIPQDIAIITFDDLPLAEVTNPPLTVVAQPTEQIGEESAHMLLERVASRSQLQAREVLLKPRLILRKST